jgi:two-component system OmpR family response regulator
VPEVRARVLVVDDEVYIADAVATSLRHAGYETRTAFDGRSALTEAQAWAPDVLLLDVMLPDMTGYDVCRELILSGTDAGVIFLSARDEVGDRIRGFGVGADDYVTKPFSLEEVVARVRALVLRRDRASARQGQEESVLTYADLTLDDERHLVTRGGAAVDLSPTEYLLLRFLMENAERVMSKAQILDNVWKYDFQGDGNIVESYVSMLRKKLNAAGPPLLQTVRGFGYVLRAEVR